MADQEFLSLRQIAEMLHVNPSTVRLWVSEGRLVAQKAGARKWMVRRADLDTMLREQQNIGIPRNERAKNEAAKDWSETPEEAGLNIRSSADPLGGVR
jgi:excisionase family DNA binding protein